MLRSVILMAGFILVAVLVIAPSLPTNDKLANSIEGSDEGALTGDSAAPSAPEPVERVFATDDSSVVAQPHRSTVRAPRDSSLVDLPAYDSPEARASRAPEY
ncbi:hypothetical protein FSZ31_03835 [Sphingorhabdus soli]|uniref:Uncharacterized protein n=1 Tax=Flavisphingopyxis soli TaxID=2601267 RepID=A0A5C6UP23_9SPHN|nr:hypothetical protein [Sphingorhabdus soli]TXC73866.1 hypothetical protein FSZ31_03835 [Sphingorhabdus soli]